MAPSSPSGARYPYHDEPTYSLGPVQDRRPGDYITSWRIVTMAVLAIPVGIAAALLSWLLQFLIGVITNLVFYQRLSADLTSPGFSPHPWWLILFAPVAGGMVIGVLARYGSPQIRGHGMPETMQAILINKSVIKPRLAFLKPFSAAVSIGTGGPFGAEGPIIMTGGAVGSTLAQMLKMSANERKTLLVAGAAAGMAATFNTTLAAVLLAVEILLFEFKPRSLVPVTSAVVTAIVARGPLMGREVKLPVDTSAWPQLDWKVNVEALVIAVAAVGVAWLSVQLIYRSDDAFHKLPFHWMWWPPLGGLIIGIGGLIQPKALGVGYDVMHDIMLGQGTAGMIISLFVVKLLIWGLSLGSGTSGSVLAPTFLIGASMGAVCGMFLPEVAPGFWAVIGLAAVTGGVLRAPLTGIVFTLELTHAWAAFTPLMVASIAAWGLSAIVMRRSILTEQLARRGLHVTMEYSVDPMESATVYQVMELEHFPVSDLEIKSSATLNDAMQVLLANEASIATVKKDDGTVVGSITMEDILRVRAHTLTEERIRVRNIAPVRWLSIRHTTSDDRATREELGQKTPGHDPD
ncbi:chloride channel protein [Corynebacterium mendelii]|uniref:Chloride channel protein n=1 Tax=Corynebacterium mendelii TaxID=2765362 RepID=A0A939DZI8_9CORY|nr:chloride channel protein [Corynebacterium mendelii]MBN9644139.1 chloride channel protein [Corynebacterium mendelii]